jgi:hypothetical protein
MTTINIISQINNVFPIDYIDLDELIHLIDILSEKTIGLLKHNKALTEKDKLTIESWKKLAEADKLEEIVLNSKEAKIALAEILPEFLSGILKKKIALNDEGHYQLLNQNTFYYLYLFQDYFPLIDRTSPVKIKEFIQNKKEFIKYCFGLAIFDRNDTERTIENKYDTKFMNFFNQFVVAMEEILNCNIVAISPQLFLQKKSTIYKSSLPERRFLTDRPTYILYYDNDEWYSVIYIKKGEKEKTYDDLKTPFSNMRLKKLISMEYEQENLETLIVQYEPTDIGKQLPIIKISIQNKEIKLLVGCTNNLYLYGDSAIVQDSNVIVGKLDVISTDKKIGKANIRWVAGFQDLMGLK